MLNIIKAYVLVDNEVKTLEIFTDSLRKTNLQLNKEYGKENILKVMDNTYDIIGDYDSFISNVQKACIGFNVSPAKVQYLVAVLKQNKGA